MTQPWKEKNCESGSILREGRERVSPIVGGNADWTCPLWAGKTVATCMNYLTTGGPGKELGIAKLPPTGRNLGKVKRREEMPVHTSYQPPRILLPGIHLGAAMFTTRKDPQSEWLGRDNPETNPITIKPKTASYVAEQVSWVPLPCCSLPGHPSQ